MDYTATDTALETARQNILTAIEAAGMNGDSDFTAHLHRIHSAIKKAISEAADVAAEQAS